MKKLLVLVALGIFLAAHGVVTAMTFHPQLALVDGFEPLFAEAASRRIFDFGLSGWAL